MALGNRFLLNRPLLQIQVSRRDFAYKREETRPHAGEDQTGRGAGEYRTGRGAAKIAHDAAGAPIAAFVSEAFSAKEEALLLAAKRGAVLLSPCVSDGEHAPGLTPRQIIEKFRTVMMVDVVMPTTDGRTVTLPR